MPNVPHDDLVRRDLAREQPFKESGAGYRDALIWESVRDVAEPGRKVALLTANYRDFGTGVPVSTLARVLPAQTSVTVLNKLAEVRPWLDGHDPQPAAYRHVESPLPFSAIVGELSHGYFGSVTGVRFGTRLHLDADIDGIDEWIELWDTTEYVNIHENTGAFDAVVVGDAFVSATVSRDLLGLLDEDVSISIDAGAEEASVSCRRPVRLAASIQYRVDTQEIADVDELSVTYHAPRA